MQNNFNNLEEIDISQNKEKDIEIKSNYEQDDNIDSNKDIYRSNKQRKNYEEIQNDKSVLSNRNDCSINSKRPLNEEDNTILNNRNIIEDSKTIFPVDITKIAEDCFRTYIKNYRKVFSSTIDNHEFKNLLEVIGIKKNEYEINNVINKVKTEKSKTFEHDQNGYTIVNFIDVAKELKEYRIDDKLLVKVFKTIDDEGDGLIGMHNMEEISKKLNLDLSKEEINDMLGYFDIENIVKHGDNYIANNKFLMTFEEFSKLYYQG